MVFDVAIKCLSKKIKDKSLTRFTFTNPILCLASHKNLSLVVGVSNQLILCKLVKYHQLLLINEIVFTKGCFKISELTLLFVILFLPYASGPFWFRRESLFRWIISRRQRRWLTAYFPERCTSTTEANQTPLIAWIIQISHNIQDSSHDCPRYAQRI